MRLSLGAVLLIASMAVAARGQPPTIDGVFTEWSPALVVASDPKGDATGAFDVSEVSATTSGPELYLHFDIGTDLNLQSGPEGDGTLGLTITLPTGQRLNIDFRGRTALLEETPIPWAQFAFICLPTDGGIVRRTPDGTCVRCLESRILNT